VNDRSTWHYTIRVGYADEGETWVAQILDDLGEELLAITRGSLNEALGEAAVAIMDVEDEESSEGT
jgi:hypothetical protein